MVQFKVGDRIQAVESYFHYLVKGQQFDVERVDIDEEDAYVLVNGRWFNQQRFEPVEPLKASVGATIKIGDGQDEWVIIAISGDESRVDVVRGGAHLYLRNGLAFTVVKAAPEPPKPDYYVNAKGSKGPRRGDVCREDGAVYLWDDVLAYPQPIGGTYLKDDRGRELLGRHATLFRGE